MNKQNIVILSIVAAVNILLVWIIANLHVSHSVLIGVSCSLSAIITSIVITALRSGFQLFTQAKSVAEELLLAIGSVIYVIGGVPITILAITLNSLVGIAISGIYFSASIGVASIFWKREEENQQILSQKQNH